VFVQLNKTELKLASLNTFDCLRIASEAYLSLVLLTMVFNRIFLAHRFVYLFTHYLRGSRKKAVRFRKFMLFDLLKGWN